MNSPDPFAFAAVLFLEFKRHVERQILARHDRAHTIDSYIPHGLSHIQGVEASIDELCTLLPRGVSPLETTLLRFCAWTHDLGMIRMVGERYQGAVSGAPAPYPPWKLRRDYSKASAYYVQITVPELFTNLHRELGGVDGAQPRRAQVRRDFANLQEELGISPSQAREPGGEVPNVDPKVESVIGFAGNEHNLLRGTAHAATLANTINLITLYHRRAEPIIQAPARRHFLGTPVRIRLLAALFRLADALHVDRTRFEQAGFEVLVNSPYFTDESRVHWIKSFIVSSIRINAEENAVHVQADIPASQELGGREFGVDSDRLRAMLSYIVNDLSDDVMSVSRILLREEFPPLLGVTSEVHQIPAMLYPEDVRAALDHIYASASPNTTRLITIALDVLAWHLRQADYRTLEEATTYLEAKACVQIGSMWEQLQQRSCHEGLRKVHDLLKAVLTTWSAHRQNLGNLRSLGNDDRRILHMLLDGVCRTFIDQRELVNQLTAEHSEFLSVFDGCSDVVVYGYSEQVLGLFRSLMKTRSELVPAVHVLECRTKTAYAASGDLLYLDADRYARAFRRDIHYHGPVIIEPDVAVGRILKGAREKGHRAVILLGSNAVYPDGTFVHSMGHVTVASAAKAPHLAGSCRVAVLTDSMKIGVLRRHKEVERNAESWLTWNKNIIRELKEAKIELRNWREDEVPCGLTDDLLVLDRGKLVQSPSFGKIGTWRFAAAEVYAEKLPIRFLASFINHARVTGWGLCQELLDEIANRGVVDKRRDVNLGNWRVAEAYILTRRGVPLPPENPTPIHENAAQWLEDRWSKTSGEIEAFARLIVAEYERLAKLPISDDDDDPLGAQPEAEDDRASSTGG